MVYEEIRDNLRQHQRRSVKRKGLLIYSGLFVRILIVSLNSDKISESRGLDFCTMSAAKFRVYVRCSVEGVPDESS